MQILVAGLNVLAERLRGCERCRGVCCEGMNELHLFQPAWLRGQCEAIHAGPAALPPWQPWSEAGYKCLHSRKQTT